MNPVEVFATVAQKQYALLEWLNAVDSSYRETEIEFWPQRRKNGRRGWTSHDVRRQQFAFAVANASLSNLPIPPRHMLTRVEVGLKILPSLKLSLVADAANAAMHYCTFEQPQYASVKEVIFELMVAHRDWVEFIAGNGSDDPRITDHYRDLCNELGGMRAMMNHAPPSADPPISLPALYELCVGKMNRVGREVAGSDATVRGWRNAKGFPKQMTWQAVRDWLNTRKDYDIGPPPTEC